MGIRYTTKVDGDTLIVHASGFDENLLDVQNYATGIIEACIQSGVTRVLCDESDLEYRLGTFDTYRAGEFLSTNAPAVAKIAIICNPAFLSNANFFENVVVNRRLRLRVFTDIETARNWLSDPDT
ncbi:MAG: hypothetical protein HGA72_04835 [Chlorobiaceae bacterium]|jgi:hypothetical protein|nr:hypothetical protein [Chlorobiaceae bacterium]NTW62687.1 hypothetical protein [Chlorobiaceae bacterium]